MITEAFASNLLSRKTKRQKTTIGTDTVKRSILKAISWRIIGTLDTILIAWILTDKMVVAISIGSIELVSKMMLYFFHERLWAHFNWGIVNTKKQS